MVPQGGAASGISRSGFDLFGDANFSGDNLQDPMAVDGLNYRITSAGTISILAIKKLPEVAAVILLL